MERAGQCCLEACLVIWSESPWTGCQGELKRLIPSIVDKSQESIFTCLHTLQARIQLPAPFNTILSNKECLSCVAGKIPGAKLSVSCIPAKLGSFEKYIFRQIKEWIVPIFYKNPNPLSSIYQITLTKEPFLNILQIIQFLLMHFLRRRRRGLTTWPPFKTSAALLQFMKWLGKGWSRNMASLLWSCYGVIF